MGTAESCEPLRPEIRGGVSHFVWDDDTSWGERSAETYLDSLSRFCAAKPDATFLRFDGSELTFGELDRRALRMANALARHGVAKGTTVTVLMENSEDMILSFVAVTRLGGIWVPVNTAYRGEFLRHQLADSGAALMICDGEYLGNVLAIAPELDALKMIVVRDHEVDLESPIPLIALNEIRGSDDTPIATPVEPHDIACLIYTSGTTGVSKGCMLSHNCLCGIARRRNVSVAPQPGDVTWSCLPLFHIASLTAVFLANLLAGEQAAIGGRFSVSRFWDDIEQSGATSAVLLSSMLSLVANAPDCPAMDRCRGQLRVVTGVPLSPPDRKTWHERFGVSFMNTFAYGQTEANLVSLLPWGEPLPPLASMGPPSRDFDAMVVGDDRRPVPLGEVGELAVRPRHPDIIFSGYWRRPAETLKGMRDLWWHTGDLVRMDGRGYLYFIDRKKDYLRSRGENISSFEVESALMKHDAVAEVAFHSVVSAEGLEDDIKATVVLRPGRPMSERALFEWAQANLPYFAVPRLIEFRLQLPKTPTGRVQKEVLRSEGRTDATWDAVAAGFDMRRKRSSSGR